MIVDRCVVTGEVTAPACIDQLFQDEATAIITIGDFGDLSAAAEVPHREPHHHGRCGRVDPGLGRGDARPRRRWPPRPSRVGPADARSRSHRPSAEGNALIIAGDNPRKPDPVREADRGRAQGRGAQGQAGRTRRPRGGPHRHRPRPVPRQPQADPVVTRRGSAARPGGLPPASTTLPEDLRMVAWDVHRLAAGAGRRGLAHPGLHRHRRRGRRGGRRERRAGHQDQPRRAGADRRPGLRLSRHRAGRVGYRRAGAPLRAARSVAATRRGAGGRCRGAGGPQRGPHRAGRCGCLGARAPAGHPRGHRGDHHGPGCHAGRVRRGQGEGACVRGLARGAGGRGDPAHRHRWRPGGSGGHRHRRGHPGHRRQRDQAGRRRRRLRVRQPASGSRACRAAWRAPTPTGPGRASRSMRSCSTTRARAERRHRQLRWSARCSRPTP